MQPTHVLDVPSSIDTQDGIFHATPNVFCLPVAFFCLSFMSFSFSGQAQVVQKRVVLSRFNELVRSVRCLFKSGDTLGQGMYVCMTRATGIKGEKEKEKEREAQGRETKRDE